MSTLRIDNKSDDDIIVTTDGKEHELRNGESLSLDSVEKGRHTMVFHRKRIPKETMLESEKPYGLDALKAQDEKPGSHIQLDTTVEFDVISSKAAVTVYKKALAVETLHEDVILVSYKAEISGAKDVKTKDAFANSRIKRTYILQQFKSAFLPVGLVGIIVLLMGAAALFMLHAGIKIKIGSTYLSKTYLLLTIAGGAAIFVFFIVNIIKIFKRVKELS
ncbi:MAG: hypothetical protein IJU45_03695 [Clostridia bacterium]|nr:hypothetical protein [Clostridia bacterium]